MSEKFQSLRPWPQKTLRQSIWKWLELFFCNLQGYRRAWYSTMLFRWNYVYASLKEIVYCYASNRFEGSEKIKYAIDASQKWKKTQGTLHSSWKPYQVLKIRNSIKFQVNVSKVCVKIKISIFNITTTFTYCLWFINRSFYVFETFTVFTETLEWNF